MNVFKKTFSILQEATKRNFEEYKQLFDEKTWKEFGQDITSAWKEGKVFRKDPSYENVKKHFVEQERSRWNFKEPQRPNRKDYQKIDGTGKKSFKHKKYERDHLEYIEKKHDYDTQMKRTGKIVEREDAKDVKFLLQEIKKIHNSMHSSLKDAVDDTSDQRRDKIISVAENFYNDVSKLLESYQLKKLFQDVRYKGVIPKLNTSFSSLKRALEAVKRNPNLEIGVLKSNLLLTSRYFNRIKAFISAKEKKSQQSVSDKKDWTIVNLKAKKISKQDEIDGLDSKKKTETRKIDSQEEKDVETQRLQNRIKALKYEIAMIKKQMKEIDPIADKEGEIKLYGKQRNINYNVKEIIKLTKFLKNIDNQLVSFEVGLSPEEKEAERKKLEAEIEKADKRIKAIESTISGSSETRKNVNLMLKASRSLYGKPEDEKEIVGPKDKEVVATDKSLTGRLHTIRNLTDSPNDKNILVQEIKKLFKENKMVNVPGKEGRPREPTKEDFTYNGKVDGYSFKVFKELFEFLNDSSEYEGGDFDGIKDMVVNLLENGAVALTSLKNGLKPGGRKYKEIVSNKTEDELKTTFDNDKMNKSLRIVKNKLKDKDHEDETSRITPINEISAKSNSAGITAIKDAIQGKNEIKLKVKIGKQYGRNLQTFFVGDNNVYFVPRAIVYRDDVLKKFFEDKSNRITNYSVEDAVKKAKETIDRDFNPTIKAEVEEYERKQSAEKNANEKKDIVAKKGLDIIAKRKAEMAAKKQ